MLEEPEATVASVVGRRLEGASAVGEQARELGRRIREAAVAMGKQAC
jgi:hypothetical protein